MDAAGEGKVGEGRDRAERTGGREGRGNTLTVNAVISHLKELIQSLTNCSPQVDTSTIPGEEVGLRLAHAAGFLPSSYMTDSSGDLRDIDELSQV